jgi:hypothetical protein
MATISNKLVEVISEDCVKDYADIFDKMERRSDYSPIDDSKTVYEPYTFEEFKAKFDKNRHWHYFWANFDTEDGRMERHNAGMNHGGKYYYYKRELVGREVGYGWNKRTENVWRSVTKYVDTLEEVFNAVQPRKKLQYLANGKFYGEATY